MRYRIIQHSLVESDLLEVTDYIASYAGLDIGNAKVDEITRFISRLADFPKIGSLRDELSPGLRAIPAAEKAVVCFTVNDETRTVIIMCIGYAGSDWAARVKDRR
jgi:plasmid stabilization system protein ParE